MNLHSLTTALIAVAAFALILYRQLRPQPVGAAAGSRRPLVFGAIGVVLAGQYVLHHPVTTLSVVGLLVSLVLAGVLSYFRGKSVRLWRQGGEWWRRGTALTLALWFGSIGSHLGIDALVGQFDPAEGIGRGFGNATTLLYLGLSLGLQHLVVVRRTTARAEHHTSAPTEDVTGLAG